VSCFLLDIEALGGLAAAPIEREGTRIMPSFCPIEEAEQLTPRIRTVSQTGPKKLGLRWSSSDLGAATQTATETKLLEEKFRNSKAVADKHYVKPAEVLLDVRKALNGAVSGLTVGNLCATETEMGSCNYLKIWRGRRDSNPRPLPCNGTQVRN
jgi:hypothetical protein